MSMEDKIYSYKYPRPAVTTDCVIFGFDGIISFNKEKYFELKQKGFKLLF
jgi:hypothetical protein